MEHASVLQYLKTTFMQKPSYFTIALCSSRPETWRKIHLAYRETRHVFYCRSDVRGVADVLGGVRVARGFRVAEGVPGATDFIHICSDIHLDLVVGEFCAKGLSDIRIVFILF